LSSEQVVHFVQTYLGSVWALKLMLMLRDNAAHSWSVSALNAELRASIPLVAGLLSRFQRFGLVAECEPGTWAWCPASPELADTAAEVAEAYALSPVRIIELIAAGPADPIILFADAFRLRKD